MVPCGERMREAACDDVCGVTYGKRPAAASGAQEPPQALSDLLFDTFDDQRTDTPEGVVQYDAPAWEDVADYYAGVGVVMFSGGERLLMTFMNALYLRIVVGSVVPIQVWRHEGEGDPTPEMLELSTQYGIEHYLLTDDNGGYAHFRWEDRWMRTTEDGVRTPWLEAHKLPLTVKPIPPLLSRFETVIFLDDDAVAIEDPLGLVRLLRSDQTVPPEGMVKGANPHAVPTRGDVRRDGTKPEYYSAVFYRDIWSMFRDASIWRYTPWPTEHAHHVAQDSGVYVVAKRMNGGEGFRGLAAAAYMSVHHKIYYPAVYESADGHAAIGAGDKDMFQVGWLAQDIPYRMMGAMMFVGRKTAVCGHSMGQPDERGQLSVIHFNGIKFKYTAFLAGFFDDRAGFTARVGQMGVNHTVSPYFPNCCDGFHTSGVRFVQRKQRLPETYCLQFQRTRNVPSSPRHIDWPFEQLFLQHLKNVYTAPFAGAFVHSLARRQGTIHTRAEADPHATDDDHARAVAQQRFGEGDSNSDSDSGSEK